MDYVCRYKNCSSSFSQTLEGLASVVIVKIIVHLDKKSDKFEKFFAQILHYAQFLKHDYSYTVILKRSVFESRDLDEEFRYYKVEFVDILFTHLLHVVSSPYMKKIIFANNRSGIASLNCEKHEKNVQSLDFFLWTSEVNL